MVRNLYRDHWLLGAQKDTMPRRKWFRFVGSSLAAFLASQKTKSQAEVSITAELVSITAELKAGSPESWEGSHPLSVWSM